jgi:hypothetical protein
MPRSETAQVQELPFNGAPDFSLRRHWKSFPLFLVLAIFFTLPASLSPGSRLLGDGGDNYQHAWFVWHFAHALSSAQNPFLTDLILYPYGANLAWSTYDPLGGLLAVPFSLALGPLVAYNFSVILQLALTAFFAYLLCLRISENVAASMVGAIVFGFSPYMLAHAQGHLALITAFPMLLYVLALDHLMRKESPRWKDGLYLGLALLLTAFTHLGYVVFCVLLTVVILLVDLAMRGPRRAIALWSPLALGALTFLVAFSPLLWMMMAASDPPLPRPLAHIERYSATLVGFVIPSWNHWLWRGAVRSMDLRLFAAGYEGTTYPGFAALLLAFLGIRFAPARQRPWAVRAGVAGLVFFALSLGPQVRLDASPGIPGPAALLYKMEGARFLSAPARFHVITSLCLALLASLGVSCLLARLARPRDKGLLALVIVGCLGFEYCTFPFPASPITNPAYEEDRVVTAERCSLPTRIHDCTVLTAPLLDWRFSNKSMWMQLQDGGRYRLADGYTSHTGEQVVNGLYSKPILRHLLALQGSLDAPVDVETARRLAPAFVRSFNICAVAIHESPHRAALSRYVQDVFGGEPVATPACTIFELPSRPARGASRRASWLE